MRIRLSDDRFADRIFTGVIAALFVISALIVSNFFRPRASAEPNERREFMKTCMSHQYWYGMWDVSDGEDLFQACNYAAANLDFH